MGWFRRLLFMCVLPVLWVAAATAALIDATQFLVIFRENRSGGSFALGCLLAGVALAGILFWTCRIRALTTDSGVLKYCYGLLAAVLIAKIGWCYWLDSAQPNDMGRYWRYGQLLANGSREELISDGMFSLGVFVRRAFFYTAVIFRFAGTEQRHLEFVNVTLQMGTLWMLFLWGRSAIGLRATAIALPWYVLYPDWWFAPTLASHDIPAMLLLSCILWASEGVRCELCHSQSPPSRARKMLLFYTIFGGVCTAYLHMVRDFGPIMLLAAALGVGLYFWGYGDFRSLWSQPFSFRSRESAIIQCFALFFLVYTGTQRTLLWIEGMPELRESSTLGLLHITTSVGTDEDGTFGQIAPWYVQYMPGIPVTELNEMSARKILWEKLGKGLAFWAHVYRKKQVLAYSGRTMEYAFGGVGGDEWFDIDLSHLAWGRVFSGIIYGCLAFLFLLRLLLFREVIFQPGECFALIMAAGLLIPLLLATESQHAYDQLFAMPMGAALGVMAGVGRVDVSLQCLAQWGRRLIIGVGCSAILMGLQAALGVVVHKQGLTFATLDQVECSAGECDFSAVRLSLDLSKPPREQNGSAELAGADFRLSGRSLEDGVLKFFLSSDHMNRKLIHPMVWGDCPWTWEILIDGAVVRSGLVRELSSPVMAEVKLPTAGLATVKCRLVVRGDPQWKAAVAGSDEFESGPQPRIAMEYCY